jgi:hypothetical protein
MIVIHYKDLLCDTHFSTVEIQKMNKLQIYSNKDHVFIKKAKRCEYRTVWYNEITEISL